MENKYNKKVNKRFFSTVTIAGLKPAKVLTEDEIKNGGTGYVFSPYVIGIHTRKSLKDYRKFMVNYHKQHEACPKCGETGHTSTLMGYILYADKREDYKDLNACVCSNCGDRHTTHERISIKQFNNRTTMNLTPVEIFYNKESSSGDWEIIYDSTNDIVTLMFSKDENELEKIKMKKKNFLSLKNFVKGVKLKKNTKI